jgi:hypothetical protein
MRKPLPRKPNLFTNQPTTTMNLIHPLDLCQLIDETLPYDQQTRAIEAFFTDATFEALGVANDDSNESNQAVMQAYIDSQRCEMPEEVRDMLESWLTDGF